MDDQGTAKASVERKNGLSSYSGPRVEFQLNIMHGHKTQLLEQLQLPFEIALMLVFNNQAGLGARN